MLCDDGVSTLRGPLIAFISSDKLFPATLKTDLAKGDRVWWTDEETREERHGVVEKVQLCFVTAVTDGGGNTIKAVAGVFSRSDKPLPCDCVATPMDAYQVRGYRKTAGHEESQPFVARVYRDGKKILAAENDGRGGCNLYRGSRSDLGRFQADGTAWAAAFGHLNAVEPEDCWLDWFVNYRPFGGLAADYLRSLAAPAEWQE